VTERRRATQYLLRSLSDSEGNDQNIKTKATSTRAQDQGLEKPFFKKPNLLVLGFYWIWTLLVFQFFYLNKQLGSLLVDLAHQLRFYLDSPVL